MYKLIIAKLSKYKFQVTILFILNIIISFLTLLSPYIAGKYVDILSITKNNTSLFNFVLVYIFIKIGSLFSVYIYSVIFIKLKSNLVFDFNKEFIQHISHAPMEFISKHNSIYLSQRINTDSGKVIDFIFNDIYKFISTVFNLLIILFFFININLTVISIAILSCILYIFTFYKFKSKLHKSSYDFFESQNKYASSINEPYNNIKNIKQNSVLDIFIERLNREFIDFFKSTVKYSKTSYVYRNYIDGVYTISSSIIMLLCGVQVLKNKLTIGSVVSIVNYFNIMLSSLGNLLSIGQKYQEFKVAYDRLNEILKIDKVKDGNISIDKIKSLEFKSINVNINNTNILNDFNYLFKPGNIYVICGKNGKGKSTLLNLITGAIDDYEGTIFLNDTNIKYLNSAYFKRENISFIGQDVFLLKDTIKNNICLNKKGINNSCINYYMEFFNFKEYLHKHNKTLDELIDDNISGGEKQKIGLIRSSLKDSDLIIWDEPTSALDINTTQRVKEYILKVKKDKIVIVVSHDEEILKISDYTINLNML
ncbi:MAG: ABC transporter ATP-binding protein [Bacilli bacterium]